MEELVNKESFAGTYVYPAFAKRALAKIPNLLPIYPSVELSEIVSSLLTDGHLAGRKIDGHIKYDYLGYFSKNDEDLVYFNSLMKKIFGIEGKIRDWGKRINGRSRGVIICNSAVSRILMLCGVATGEKVTKNYDVPNWILNGSPMIKAAFLRRAFSCEGSISPSGNSGWKIRYSMGKTRDLIRNGYEFLNQIRNLMLDLDVETTRVYKIEEINRKKDNKTTVMLCILVRQKSVFNFADKIGFDIAYKNDKLQKAKTWATTVRDFGNNFLQS